MVATRPLYLRWHYKGQIGVQPPQRFLLSHSAQVTEDRFSWNLNLTIPTFLGDDGSFRGIRGFRTRRDGQRRCIRIDEGRVLEVVFLNVLVKPLG